MTGDELLTANLAVIERVIAFVCRRYHFEGDDAEDFAGTVRLRLVENNYAILRAHAGRSSLATYLSVVVQRMALDERIHRWGKWHASAEAKRLGELAVALEQLLHRDGRTLDEAFVALAAHHEGVTRESLQALAARLPERAPKLRGVSLDDAAPATIAARDDTEAIALATDRRRTAERLAASMTDLIEKMPEDERLLLQLRYQEGMTVAQIARVMQYDQKLLYRRMETAMKAIRKEVEKQGFAASEILDLLGRDDSLVAFDLGKRKPRPSIGADETVAKRPEDSR